ncbi:uncharacterized protein [Leptinotarsa decemlineata]|uniref:uncharacterized protein n=1 Tax=Leptinotarsa decemlineata TaxID=7539 RepID=UPI003D30C543
MSLQMSRLPGAGGPTHLGGAQAVGVARQGHAPPPPRRHQLFGYPAPFRSPAPFPKPRPSPPRSPAPPTPNICACTPLPSSRMCAPTIFPPLTHRSRYPPESTPQHSVREVISSRAVHSTTRQYVPTTNLIFEMATNTQEVNNAVASILPVSADQEEAASSRAVTVDQPTTSRSRVRCRSSSPDLFEEEEEVRAVKKVCQRPAAKVGPISKYRATCNRTNPYAGSFSTSRKRASTPAAAPAAVEIPRSPSPELVILSPLVTRLPPLPATPADPEVLVPQPIGEVSEKMSVFLQRCKKAERAARSSEAALVTMKRQMAEMDNRRREIQKEMAGIDRNYASLQERCKAETSSIKLYKKIVTVMDTLFVDEV